MSKWLEIAKGLNKATSKMGENQKKDQLWCADFMETILETSKKTVAWCGSLGKPPTGEIAVFSPNQPDHLGQPNYRRKRIMEKYDLDDSMIPGLGHLYYSNDGVIDLDHLTEAEVDRIIESYNNISDCEMRCLLGETNESS